MLRVRNDIGRLSAFPGPVGVSNAPIAALRAPALGRTRPRECAGAVSRGWVMAYQFTLSTILPATPQAIYRAWLDTRLHSAMTGGAAVMSS